MQSSTINGIKLNTSGYTTDSIEIASGQAPAISLALNGLTGSSWGSAVVVLEASLDGGDTWQSPIDAPSWSAPGMKYIRLTDCHIRLVVDTASGGSDDDEAVGHVRISSGILALGRDDAT